MTVAATHENPNPTASNGTFCRLDEEPKATRRGADNTPEQESNDSDGDDAAAYSDDVGAAYWAEEAQVRFKIHMDGLSEEDRAIIMRRLLGHVNRGRADMLNQRIKMCLFSLDHVLGNLTSNEMLPVVSILAERLDAELSEEDAEPEPEHAAS